MSKDVEPDDLETPEEAPQTQECRQCEAVFTIALDENYLFEQARYCPYCGEYIVAEDDD